MSKVKATWRARDGMMVFEHFIVKKDSDNFFGVYHRGCGLSCGGIVTSGATFKSACKKAKLLEIGWDFGEQCSDAFYKEKCKYCSL